MGSMSPSLFIFGDSAKVDQVCAAAGRMGNESLTNITVNRNRFQVRDDVTSPQVMFFHHANDFLMLCYEDKGELLEVLQEVKAKILEKKTKVVIYHNDISTEEPVVDAIKAVVLPTKQLPKDRGGLLYCLQNYANTAGLRP